MSKNPVIQKQKTVTIVASNGNADISEFQTGNTVETTEKIDFGFWNLSSMRFYVALLLNFSVFSNCLMRTNLSMGMVCMVNSSALAYLHEDSKQFEEGQGGGNSSTGDDPPANLCKLPSVARSEYEGTFVWTSDQQAMLFAAIFWGGLISGFPAGWLADRYGPKNLVLLSVLSNILGSVLSPVSADRGGYAALFVVRFIMGVGQGIHYPCLASMMSRWFSPKERSTVIAIYTAGNQMAMIAAMPISAWLCEQKQFLGGWPAIFYTSGLFGLVWCLIWVTFLTNSPEKHRKISHREMSFIALELESQNLQNRKAASKSVPWVQMLKSVPLLTNMLSMFLINLLFSTIQSYLPTYFKDVLLLEIHSNGFYSALPFIFQWIAKFSFAPIADALKRKTSLSHTVICKVFQGIAHFGSGLCFIGLSFVTCVHQFLAISLLCLLCFCLAGTICGAMTSLVSIAPTYSGTVNSYSRVTSQLGAVLSPYLVGAITKHGTQQEWRIVFLTIAGMDLFCGIIFSIFGSAEIQDWAKPPTSKQSQVPLCVTESSAKFNQSDANFPPIVGTSSDLNEGPDSARRRSKPVLFHLTEGDDGAVEQNDSGDEGENGIKLNKINF